MKFEDIVKERHAAKQFDTEKKVSKEDLGKLLEIIRLAPSAFNIQPWKVIVISNQELKEKLFPHSFNQPQVKTCSHLLVFCADKNIISNIENLEKDLLDAGSDPESIKGYLDMMKGFEGGMSEQNKISWAQRQLYIALGNALNGAKSLGFDSCPMEGFNPEEYSKILELPENLIPTAICTIGYSIDSKNPKLRFSKEKVFEFRE